MRATRVIVRARALDVGLELPPTSEGVAEWPAHVVFIGADVVPRNSRSQRHARHGVAERRQRGGPGVVGGLGVELGMRGGRGGLACRRIWSRACRWAVAVGAATSRWAWAPSRRARSGLCSRDSIAADQAGTLGGSISSPLWWSMSAVSSPPMRE